MKRITFHKSSSRCAFKCNGVCVNAVKLRHKQLISNQLLFPEEEFSRKILPPGFAGLSAPTTRRAQDSELYDYDELYRLTSWERGELNADKDAVLNPVHDQTWNLDPVGNWDETSYDGITETRQHNAVNEVIHRDNDITTGLVYDDNGNLIEDHEHEYTYDAFNRLVQVVRKSDSQVIATYRYDTQNRRVMRIVENSGDLNGTTQYVYDGWQVVEERDGQDTVTATYTYGNYIDEPITFTTLPGSA